MPASKTWGRPLLRFVPDGTRIHFMRGRVIGLATSATLSLLSVVLFFTPGLKLGIDFSGGIVVEAQTPGPADFGHIRAALERAGIHAAGVQRFGAADDVLVRLNRGATEAATQNAVDQVRGALAAAAPGTKVLRADAVGASVSNELFRDGMLALFLSLAMILAYIWFRFEWEFAVERGGDAGAGPHQDRRLPRDHAASSSTW